MAAVATVVKVCTKLVHNGTERVKCDTEYKGTECPNQSSHLYRLPTGFCNGYNKIAQHEGEKPKSSTGKPLPTCGFYMLCPCVCHKRIDDMFKLTGMERVLIENPEYVPDRIDFNIEDYINVDEVADPFMVAPPVDPLNVEDRTEHATVTLVAPITTRRTDTGRAARGGLEAQVWEQCRVFAAAGIEATPKMLSELIRDKYKIPTPSTGAIGAVFNRWEALGFAEQGRKPVRFIKFCKEGTWQELELLKAKKKRTDRRTESSARRGYR